SPLAQTAELVVPLLAGEERAVAATKTYTAQLFALAMLSVALDDESSGWSYLARVPQAVERCLATNADLAGRLDRFPSPDRLVVIGRGFNYATAFEIALKLEETCSLVAEPYSSADFRHGPIALVEPGFSVVVVAPSGAVFADVADLVDELQALRATLAVISDEQAVLTRAALAMPLPQGVPEWLSPIVAVVPGQLLAVALAHARGSDPDRPRGLRKVTETR
ncbi:MAG: SIS domain-containing protein, partial [Thermomicrobium sp.]|nr:SIS domain-containing protein [Thermomicrobium sp.]